MLLINLNFIAAFKGATKSHFTNYYCVVIVLLIRLYAVVHFIQFLLENKVIVFLCFLWIKALNYASSCDVILICSFVLTLYKKSLFLNNKLFTKVLQYYVKTCFQRWFIKKSVEQSWNIECKKRYHKKVSYESFSNLYEYSIR